MVIAETIADVGHVTPSLPVGSHETGNPRRALNLSGLLVYGMVDRTRNLALGRLYLDSDALIKARIESLPAVQKHHHFKAQKPEAKREVCPAGEILDKWNPQLSFASMHTLMETLNCGVRTYGLSFDAVVEAVYPSIGRDFTVLFGDFELVRPGSALVEKFESRIPTPEFYAKSRVAMRVKDAQGRELGTLRHGTTVTSGGVAHDFMHGSPATMRDVAEVESIESHRIEAPKFERELFLRTVEVASDYKIAPKDAMHIVCAQGRAENVVTTDKGFLAALNAKDKSVFPRGIRPSEVLNRWGHLL